MSGETFPKGQMVTYRSYLGFRYSALVLRAHRDGMRTGRLCFPLNDDGTEREGCFQGDKYRVDAHHLSAALASAQP